MWRDGAKWCGIVLMIEGKSLSNAAGGPTVYYSTHGDGYFVFAFRLNPKLFRGSFFFFCFAFWVLEL